MPKYRKITGVKKAYRIPDKPEDDRVLKYWPELCLRHRFWRRGLWLKTLDGWIRVIASDWVLFGEVGALGTCTEDEFYNNYGELTDG